MSIISTLRRILNDTPGTATNIDYNFQVLEDYVNASVVHVDGANAMTGNLTLFGPPTAAMHAVSKSYVEDLIPAGVSWEYGGDVAPAGWVLEDGTTRSSTDPLYQRLFGVIGYKFGDAGGGNFRLPPPGRFTIGRDAAVPAFATVGNTGGLRDAELLAHVHQVPVHGHTSSASTNFETQDHVHGLGSAGGTMSNAAPHTHNFGDGSQIWYSPGSGQGFSPVSGAGVFHAALATFAGSGAAAGVHTHTLTGQTDARSAAHNHAVSISVNDKAAFDTVSVGAGTTLVDKNLPPYVVMNRIMKL